MNAVEIISQDIELSPKNENFYGGLCPFHEDTRPSFWVNIKGFWGCFACGEKGDIVKYIFLRKECDSYQQAEQYLKEQQFEFPSQVLSYSNKYWMSLAYLIKGSLTQLSTLVSYYRGTTQSYISKKDLRDKIEILFLRILSELKALNDFEAPSNPKPLEDARFDQQTTVFLFGSDNYRKKMLNLLSLSLFNEPMKESNFDSLVSQL